MIFYVESAETISLKGQYQEKTVFGTWLGQDQDYLGESPEWLYRYLLLRATVGVRAPMRPGETPVWSESSVDERNLYFARSAIIGLAVETWRVKTELIIITILHYIIISASILNLGFKNNCAKNIGAYKMHKYTVTRRSAEFPHPARMTQDSSCYIGENDCSI